MHKAGLSLKTYKLLIFAPSHWRVSSFYFLGNFLWSQSTQPWCMFFFGLWHHPGWFDELTNQGRYVTPLAARSVSLQSRSRAYGTGTATRLPSYRRHGSTALMRFTATDLYRTNPPTLDNFTWLQRFFHKKTRGQDLSIATSVKKCNQINDKTP